MENLLKARFKVDFTLNTLIFNLKDPYITISVFVTQVVPFRMKPLNPSIHVMSANSAY